MSVTKQLNWGLIGCGDIARRRVAPALQNLDNCKLIAVNRANPDKLKSFALEFGAENTYLQWQDLIANPNIQAVYLATPVNLHAEMTINAANAGKHVLCEKPMAMTDQECERMIEACKQNDVHLGAAYYRHHYPVIHRAKQIIARGLIGDVMLVQMNAFSHFDRNPGEPRYWLLKKEISGGGPMMDFGCHRIEVMLDVLGPIKNVWADVSHLRFKRDVEDTAIAHFEFSSGARGTLTVTHTVLEGQDTLNIFGTEGSIHVPVLNHGKLILKTTDGTREEMYPPHTNLHLPLIDDFTQSILENRSPAVTGEMGLEVNKILTKIYTNTF